MNGYSRRDFLSLTGSAAVAAMSAPAYAAMGPNDKFDLVIKAATCSIPASRCGGNATSAFAGA